jgi:hypothetical protein
MNVKLPSDVREDLEELVLVLSDLDALLERLGPEPRAAPTVQLLAGDVEAFRQRAVRHAQRLRLSLAAKVKGGRVAAARESFARDARLPGGQ